jgi:hypothetical protein
MEALKNLIFMMVFFTISLSLLSQSKNQSFSFFNRIDSSVNFIQLILEQLLQMNR